MKHFAGRVQRQVFTGLILIVPFAVTILVAVFIYRVIDQFVGPIVRHVLRETAAQDPGALAIGIHIALTMTATVILLYLVGLAATTIAMRKLYGAGERLLSKNPFIKGVHGIAKQVFNPIASENKTRFKRMALVEFPRRGMWSVGFVTGETRLAGDPRRFVSVFIPHVPNPMTGFLIVLPDDRARTIDMGVEDGLKLIMSGGLSIPDMLTPAPLAAPSEDSEQGRAT